MDKFIVDDLYFSYGVNLIFKGVLFELKVGEVVCLFGVLGSGKIMLLCVVVGFE